MIFSILTFVFIIASVCIKDRKRALIAQSLSCLFESIYSFTLNALTGAVLQLINFVRSFIYIQKYKINKKIYFLILLIFEGIVIANCIYTWIGPISLLPTIGSVIRTYCLWQSRMKLIRISGITTGITYGLYFLYYGSWFIVAGYIILIIAGAISIYENDIKKKSINSVLECDA